MLWRIVDHEIPELCADVFAFFVVLVLWLHLLWFVLEMK